MRSFQSRIPIESLISSCKANHWMKVSLPTNPWQSFKKRRVSTKRVNSYWVSKTSILPAPPNSWCLNRKTFKSNHSSSNLTHTECIMSKFLSYWQWGIAMKPLGTTLNNRIMQTSKNTCRPLCKISIPICLRKCRMRRMKKVYRTCLRSIKKSIGSKRKKVWSRLTCSKNSLGSLVSSTKPILLIT